MKHRKASAKRCLIVNSSVKLGNVIAKFSWDQLVW